MKKILPAIVISIVFTALLMAQLIINGQQLSASLTENEKSKHGLFEDQYSKLVAKTANGHDVDLKILKQPIVILNFWASWCLPCLAEFEGLNKLIVKYPLKVYVLGINNDTEAAINKIKEFQKKYLLNFESISDVQGKYAENFKILSLPSTIVFHKGKVIKFINGQFDFMSKEFLDFIEKNT